MNLENEFTVPVPVEDAWDVLLDVERVAPCMPGATLLTVDGDEFTGTVKVKVGPLQMTYKGQAAFVEKDPVGRKAVITATGKETRGAGTAAATVTITPVAQGSSTRVTVLTDLNITGRPAQFGRGVMSEVAGKLIDQFARCLEQKLSAASDTAPSQTAAIPADSATADIADAADPATAETPVSAPRQHTAAPTPPLAEPEAINLLDVAGASVAKRVVPLVAALILALVLLGRRRRRRRG